jgi:hypothetical protein
MTTFSGGAVQVDAVEFFIVSLASSHFFSNLFSLPIWQATLILKFRPGITLILKNQPGTFGEVTNDKNALNNNFRGKHLFLDAGQRKLKC